MGTRGLYGIRKDGFDKTTYNHYDSYPDCLGHDMVKFCASHSPEEMKKLFDSIILVREDDTPTAEQIEFCVGMGYLDKTVSTKSENDWYCLLRNIQGDLSALYDCYAKNGRAYMIDSHEFICDSLFCEYAYIINLDTEMFEFWMGFQHEPCEGNRYGVACNDGYYPCRKVLEISLSACEDVEAVVAIMNNCE